MISFSVEFYLNGANGRPMWHCYHKGKLKSAPTWPQSGYTCIGLHYTTAMFTYTRLVILQWEFIVLNMVATSMYRFPVFLMNDYFSFSFSMFELCSLDIYGIEVVM